MKKSMNRWWVLLGLGMALAGMAVFLGACSQATGGEQAGSATAPAATATGAAAITQANCPVMGNPINRDIYVDHQGRRIYFCCSMCPDKFKADPAKYLAILDGGQPAASSGMSGCAMDSGMSGCAMESGMGNCAPAGAASPAASSGNSRPTATATKYTCSMCPEVVTDAPGRCPKCGMNLVPKR